jgi:hypothetical protein
LPCALRGTDLQRLCVQRLRASARRPAIALGALPFSGKSWFNGFSANKNSPVLPPVRVANAFPFIHTGVRVAAERPETKTI